MKRRRATGLLLAAAVIATACGSSGATTAPTTVQGTPATAAPTGAGPIAAPASATPTPGSPGQGGSFQLPAIAAGTWATASLHLEIAGDRPVTLDTEGAGTGAGGTMILTFLDEPSGFYVQLTLSSDGSVITINGPDFLAGGSFGQECELTWTRTEAARLAAEFTCLMTPVAVARREVEVQGRFDVQR